MQTVRHYSVTSDLEMHRLRRHVCLGTSGKYVLYQMTCSFILVLLQTRIIQVLFFNLFNKMVFDDPSFESD